MTPKRKEVTDKYGKATRVIEGEDISRMEDKWSYGLFSVLKYHFQDKIRIITISDLEIVYDRAVVSNGLPTLVIIDGIAVKVRSIEENEYYGLQNIPTSEVKSFEIIENAKNFQDVVCECYPPGACNGRSLLGNIIAIYTYAGKGLYGIKPTTGIIKTSVPVFAASKEFYTPKYPQLQPEDWKKPDLRTLIHWQPNVFVNSSGKATLSFYNADLTGKMQVVVEAISATGEIGYHQLLFDVKKRE
jgi:hypothetical protein